MKVTVQHTQPVKPAVESVTLVCSVEEAQTIYDILGPIGVRELETLSATATGRGSRARLADLAGRYSQGRTVIAVIWNALGNSGAIKQYTEV